MARRLGDRLISIADAIAGKEFRYVLQPGERIGWVFPTYSWGPAPIVLDFISHWHIDGYTAATYCYMVTTCGDDVGLSVEMWRKALGCIDGNAAFSVQMPNNYILMKGFDVDDELTEREKLLAAPKRVEEIALSVACARCTVDVVTGKWKWVKSRIINPWFRRHAMSDRHFFAESDKCTHCRLCVASCPLHNITIASDSSLPAWHGDCAMCLSCIHRCPARAIQYGKQTQLKGRYFKK